MFLFGELGGSIRVFVRVFIVVMIRGLLIDWLIVSGIVTPIAAAAAALGLWFWFRDFFVLHHLPYHSSL
jgi:hypothetical protein